MSFNLYPARDALFLDIDGTLLDIAPLPDGVVVPRDLIDDLAMLHEKMGGALALVSGRSLENIDKLFAPLHLPASGVHGAQWRIEAEKEEKRPLPEDIRSSVAEAVSYYPQLIMEDKRYSIAVHYRNAPELADTVKFFLQKIVSYNHPAISLMRGKMVFEIVQPGHHKGHAVEHFMAQAPFTGRRPVFLGDDETDIPAMRTCLEQGGVAVRIGQNITPFSNEFSSPLEVREWVRKQVSHG
jgi:trehalose 6-phosphate phosphatase